MKALEMEEEEVEKFLDSEEMGDGSLYTKEGPKTTKKTGGGGLLKPVLVVVSVVVMGALYFNASGESSDYPPPSPSSSGIPPPNSSPATPTETDDGPRVDPDVALVYSNLATIVPDPDHRPLTDEEKEKIKADWGNWHFYDGEEDRRPEGDYCGKYKNRDIPGDEFPDEAWQADAVYVNHFIDDAERLIGRAKEAIFTEYGHGKPLPPEELATRLKMFEWEYVDLDTQDQPPRKYENGRHGDRGNGGWTTERSFDGLVRRLLHAMMTNDSFTVVMAGHSAAAGHGNAFHQSYTMQFHKIMAPIFARLGVKLVTRNLSQGGLGTIHSSLGFRDLYGDDIDLLLWDCGMTEGDSGSVDMVYRQALMSGKKVPVIWASNFNEQFEILRHLHNEAEADVGEYGQGMDGIPETTSIEQADSLPYSTRYLKCPDWARSLCDEAPRFCVECWIPRDDVKPESFLELKLKAGGQVRWHPGWRAHQLHGRVLAFSMLEALQYAIQTWSDGTSGGPPLDEEFWHVTDYYENIRQKVMALDPSIGYCKILNEKHQLPLRVCNTPMKGRGHHTPRFKPDHSSLVSIMKVPSDWYLPYNNEKVLYDGPNKYSKCYDLPEGEVDVLAIVSNRRHLEVASHSLFVQQESSSLTRDSAEYIPPLNQTSLRGLARETIVPGKGWELQDEKPGHCDGTYDAVCGRGYSDDCPAAGHQDSRGTLVGNELSGWLVLNLPDVEHGIIIIRLITWFKYDKNKITQDWTSVNNEGRHLVSPPIQNSTVLSETPLVHSSDRDLSSKTDPIEELPETFYFDFAINGKITSWGKDEFIRRRGTPQRVVEVFTLLDDQNFPSGPVELAIRMRGCAYNCTFGVPHVYWS